MTQQEKDLLLKDLCARLPYGVKVCINLPNHQEKMFEEQIGDLKELTIYGGYLVNSKGIDYRSFKLDIKPYLRSMSSMTEEESKEFSTFYDEFEPDDYWKPGHYAKYIGIDLIDEYVDWLNAHHFDYRGLIEKGLAIEAPEGMYSY